MSSARQEVNYSLICAVREGELEKARQLINSFGLSYSRAWSEGYVLLCDAIKYNHAAVAKLLLKSGSKVNTKNKNPSDSPLHFAAINGDIEVVEMLLDKGATIDLKNRDGRTPLHNAIENKKMEVIELLIKHRADVNARDNEGKSLLHVAVEIGCLQIIEFLLKHRANVNSRDNYGTSLLHVAAEMECLQIIECLLKYGACVNGVCTSTSKKGFAPLHLAVEKGSKKVVTLLLSRSAHVDIKGEDNITPLHVAAKKGYTHIAEVLLNHGACIHSLTVKEGYMPLHFASELRNVEAVKLFLNRGADINAITKGNETPLHIATKGGHNVVKLLLQYGAKVDNQDKDGKTILHLAVEKGDLTIVKTVLKYCPDINNRSNRSSLKIAVQGYGKNYKNIVEALLEYGLNINPEDANNPMLLHSAVEKGHLKIVEDLLKYDANVNTLYKSTFTGSALLHCAARNKHEEVAKLLINNDADVNAQDNTGKTPIFYAVENADLKITKLLLASGANVKDHPELLHIAAKKKCIEIIEALVQHDADINASDKYGRTALHIAAKKKCIEIIEALVQHDTDINASDEYGRTALHFIASTESEGVTSEGTIKGEIAKLLLSKGANVNVKLKNGFTALHIATDKGHKEVVKVLLECGAEVDSKTRRGSTPLHLGAQKGYEEIIDTILKFGADIDSRDEYGRTALHIASQKGYEKVVVTLLEHGSDINITSWVSSINNYTPLDHAMAGITSYYTKVNKYDSGSDDDWYDDLDRGYCAFEVIAEILKHHIVKMKTANLYVSEKNVQAISRSYEMKCFQDECEEEIAIMKHEKINNPYISFYDILAKDTSSLAILLRNENTVQILKSDNYKTKFPIYARMIESNFKKGMERKELLEQGNKIFHFFFPELPYDCTEKILSYLSGKDLRMLIDACKPLNISNPNTNINGSNNLKYI